MEAVQSIIGACRGGVWIDHALAVSTRYQLVQGVDDLPTFRCKRMDNFSELVRGDGNKLQWMQNH